MILSCCYAISHFLLLTSDQYLLKRMTDNPLRVVFIRKTSLTFVSSRLIVLFMYDQEICHKPKIIFRESKWRADNSQMHGNRFFIRETVNTHSHTV